MRVDLKQINLAIVSPSVAGAALKILVSGGSQLDAKQMARAAGSVHLLRTHEEEIRALVQEMEANATGGE